MNGIVYFDKCHSKLKVMLKQASSLIEIRPNPNDNALPHDKLQLGLSSPCQATRSDNYPQTLRKI